MPTPRRTTSRAVSLRKTQEEQLAYYTIRAPFDGIVGDVPVHVGDYVSSSHCAHHRRSRTRTSKLTSTFPPSAAGEVRQGLAVELY